MTLEEAQAILKDNDNWINYEDYLHVGDTIGLDGWFLLEELKAIIVVVEAMKK